LVSDEVVYNYYQYDYVNNYRQDSEWAQVWENIEQVTGLGWGCGQNMQVWVGLGKTFHKNARLGRSWEWNMRVRWVGDSS